MKRELTLTDIAGYLPYDLKVQDRDQDIWVLCQLGNADPCMDGDIGLITDDGGSFAIRLPRRYTARPSAYVRSVRGDHRARLQ